MGTTLQESRTWTQVTSPNPGEPVRAGGGIGTPITIPGTGANGGVTYTPLVASVRVRHLGGVSQTLAVSVAGNDITVQLGTDGAGNVTSTADDVAVEVGGDAGAAALVSVDVTGDGTGLAGISTVWTTLGGGVLGSIRTGLQNLADRTRYLVDNAASWSAYGARLESYDGATVVAVADGLFTAVTETFTPTVDPITRYYCYYKLGASPPLEVSTTGPDAYLRGKSGDVGARYLGTFLTNDNGDIVPFRAERGQYLYDTPYFTDGSLTTDNAWHDLALTSDVPPHVRRALVYCTGDLQVRRKGAAADALGRPEAWVAGGSKWVLLNSSRQLQYKGTSGEISVLGFLE